LLSHLPKVIPESIVALSKLKRHYQLPQVAKDAMPLKGQMETFHAWATTPYQLDRVDYNAASSSTWLNHSNHVYLYMGFLHHYKDESRPTLAAFKDADKYASYLALRLKMENAALSSLMFGYMPTLRLSCLVESQGTKVTALV